MIGHLTFDYELFFGEQSGSVEKCLIEPTNALTKVARKYQAKMTFFVDSGYLIKLNEYAKKYRNVQKEKAEVTKQLFRLREEGHDIQLHVHPHWEDSYYNGIRWVLNTNRYRLASFESSDIHRIIQSYKEVLKPYALSEIFAYRAGGWCIQPFEKIGKALKEFDVWLDSTIFSGGYNASKKNYYDFRRAPGFNQYRFGNDPCKKDEKGGFLELPITSQVVAPTYYWKIIKSRLLQKETNTNWGNGTSVPQNKIQLFNHILLPSIAPLSTDGQKFSQLFAFLNSNKNHEKWVSIGHPKCLTRNNIEDFKRLFTHHHETYFSNLQDYLKDKPRNRSDYDLKKRKVCLNQWD